MIRVVCQSGVERLCGFSASKTQKSRANLLALTAINTITLGEVFHLWFHDGECVS